MAKILENHVKERMKRKILEQEETFRQQVQELHRVYRVQKQVMKEMKIKMELTPRRKLDLELPPEDIELTLAIGSSRRKREEKSNTSDSAGSYSSSSVESKSLKLLGHDWGISKVPDLYLNSHREMNNELELQKSPWLFPCLSLTMS